MIQEGVWGGVGPVTTLRARGVTCQRIRKRTISVRPLRGGLCTVGAADAAESRPGPPDEGRRER
eukprot:4619200-Pyramimonas_sp.AAC.1